MEDERPIESTPGSGGDALQDLPVHANDRKGIFDFGRGDREAKGKDFLRAHEPRLHLPECLEASNHEPGAHQKNQRERDLSDHEKAARAMPLAAFASATASFLERRGEALAAVLEEREEPEEDSGEQRDSEGEQQHRRVDPDLVQTGKALGSDGDEKTNAPVCERETEETAEDSQAHAFEQQLPRKTLPVGAESGAQRQLLLAGVGPDQEQVGDVGAGDEKHEAYRAEKDPEHVPDITHDIFFERHDVGVEVSVLQHLKRQPLGVLLRAEGDHPGYVGVGLVDSDSRLQPCDPLVAEIPHEDLCRVELEREVEVRLEPEEAKLLGKDADDLPRLPVYHERPSQDFGIGAEAPLPIGFTEDDSQGCSGGVVLGCENSPDLGLHPQQRQGPIGHEHRLDAFGLGEPGHRDLIVVPHPDLFERPPGVAVGEVECRRLVDLVEAEPGSGVPDADEPLRLLERKGLQEDAVNDAEDRGVRPDTEGEGPDRDQGEQRGAQELSKELPGRRA